MAQDVWGGAADRVLSRDGLVNTLDDRDPEAVRQSRIVGRQLGVPGPTVEADLDGFKRQAEVEKAKSLFDYAPGLAAFAADPNNAAAIKDDLPTLAELGKMLGTRDDNGPLGKRFIDRMKGSTAIPFTVPRYGAIGPDFPSRAAIREREISVAEGLGATVRSSLKATERGTALYLADMIGKGEALSASEAYRRKSMALEAEQVIAAEPGRQAETYLGQQAYSAAQSAALLGAAVLSRNPYAFYGITAGAESYGRFRERGANANEALLGATGTAASEVVFERIGGLTGFDNLFSNFGREGTTSIVKGILKGQAKEIGEEELTTITSGYIDAMITGGQGFEAYKENLPKAMLDTAVSTALFTGGLGAGAATLNLAARRLNPEVRALDDVDHATVGAAYLDKLMTKATESKVRQSDPETFKEFVASQTADTPVRDIYVPVEAINEYMQSEGYEAGALEAYQDQIAEAQATQGDVVIPVADAAAYLAGTPTWEALKDKVRLQPGGLSQKEALEQHAEIMKVLEQRGAEIAAEVEENAAVKSDAAEVFADVRNRLLAGGVESKLAEHTAKVVAARYEARGARRGQAATEAWKAAGIKFDWEVQGKQKGRKLQQPGQPLIIGNLEYEVNEDGTYTVELAADKDRKTIGDKLAIKDLRKQLGDELTARILAGEGGVEGRRTIPNLDLTMKGKQLALRGVEPSITDTAAFKKWFGDSKVVDASGEPLVVYHGTNEDFDQFELGRDAFASYFGMPVKTQRHGIFFAERQQFAEEFLDHRVNQTVDKQGRTIAAYLTIKRPFDMRDDAVSQLMDTPEGKSFEKQTGLSLNGLYQRAQEDRWEEFDGEDGADFVARLKDAGYDGAIMLEANDAGKLEKVWIAFEPTQIKSVDNRGTFDPNDPRILHQDIQDVFESVDPFYSALQRALEQNQTKRATGQQWAATLRKTPGIKQEELEWTGLLEYLEATEGLIERTALIELVEAGGIEVEEVMLGARGAEFMERLEAETQRRVNAEREDREEQINEEIDPVVWSDIHWARIEREVEDEMQDEHPETQFRSWSSDPSNDTYRELLITLPVGVAGNPSRAPSTHWDTEGVVAHARFMDKVDADGKRVLFIEEVQSDWHQKGRDQGYEQDAGPRKEETRIALEKAIDVTVDAGKALIEAASPIYRDTLQFTIRSEDTTAEEKERAQMQLEALDAGMVTSPDAMIRQLKVWSTKRAQEIRDNELKAYEAAQLRQIEADRDYQNAHYGRGQGIPNAPFKSSWPALVMKRMIRYAAENGYERVAWTTGEEQASRYSLSEAVGSISVEAWGDGNYDITLGSGRAEELIREQNDGSTRYSKEKIFEIFGKDLGERMIAAADAAVPTAEARAAFEAAKDEQDAAIRETNIAISRALSATPEEQAEADAILEKAQERTRAADKAVNATRPDGVARLEGIDLKIGGEGMKAFYDRNLVNITNDIIKKYGSKVGPVEIRQTPGQMTATMRGHEEMARKFDAGEPFTQINPGFEITDKMRDAAMQGFTLFQGPRGSTSFLSDGIKLVSLFETANESTLIHEFGHIWLEELRADAMSEGATDQEKADWESLKKWWAKQGVVVTDTSEIPTEAHEFFARTFERYFREGKAPRRDLRAAFKAFGDWLKNIYRAVSAMNAPINPTLRGIFDRMLATDEAIDAYRAQERVGPLFNNAEEAGMTEAEFAAYGKLVENARDTAYDTLLEKTMAAIRLRRRQDMREQRANVRSEIADTVNARPEFVALHLLRTGRWLGDPARDKQNVKLNTGWLIDTFGEEILDKLPRGLPITSGEGQHGDEIAEMVGAQSGQALVQALVGMRVQSEALRSSGETRSLRDKLIDDQVDEIMAQRHGDVLEDGTIEEEAIAALNTAAQGEIIGAEIRQLAKRATKAQPLTPYQFAREWAKRKVRAGRVNDTVSRSALQRYTRATAKAARLAETAILEGEVDEAYRQKQAQLLNHALLAESKAAADEVDTVIKRMRTLAGRAAMKSVDQDYMDKIHMLLENYDFRQRSQRSVEEQLGFQAWAERQRANGFEVHIPPRLENRGDPYSRVTVEELLSLNDLVQSLLHIGRTKQKLKIAQAERDFGEFVDEVVARVEQLPQRKLPDKPINEDRRLLASAASELLKIETIVEELDGGPTGPLHDAIIVGATNAENRRNQLRHDTLLPIVAAYHNMSRKQKNRLNEKVTLTELTWNTLNEGDPRIGQPVTVTRSELLSIALNMGNLSNLEKLSKGERWPIPTLQSIMDRELTKEDWDLVQLLWRQVDSLWTDIVATEREMSGVVPEKVVPVPIETRFGTYEGGYWPVVYDAARWQRAENLEEAKLDDMFGLVSGVATQKGHTISRTEAFGPINLSLENVLFQHLEQVVTRIAFTSYARDVMRIIQQPRIRGIIDTRLGPEYRKQIKPWLSNMIHEGMVDAQAARWWQGVLKQARINMMVAAMGFRFSTGIAQTLGLAASAQRIGAINVARGLKRIALSPRASAEFAFSRSPELVNRTNAANREVSEVFAQLRGKHSRLAEAQAWAFWHIGMIDRYMVALPTWLGAHQKGMDEGMTDAEASAYADKSVRLSQGAGPAKDLSAWQSTNNPAMRFFTMFYSPFNVMFNAQWQGIRGLKKGQIAPLAGVTFWWLVVSTLADALMSGDWPEDDEEGEKDWLGWFGRNVFFGAFAGIPLVRDGATYAERSIIGEYAEFGQTPVTKIGDAVERTYKIGDKLIVEGEAPERPLKQAGDLTAILTGTPTSQAGTTGQFLWDYAEGEADPQGVSDWYFGITRGKVPEEKSE